VDQVIRSLVEERRNLSANEYWTGGSSGGSSTRQMSRWTRGLIVFSIWETHHMTYVSFSIVVGT